MTRVPFSRIAALVLLLSLDLSGTGCVPGSEPEGDTADPNACEATVSGALEVGSATITFPDVLLAGIVPGRTAGLDQLGVQAYFADAGQCYILVEAQDAPFPPTEVGAWLIEFRGIACEGIDASLQDVYQVPFDITPSTRLVADLEQDTSYQDPLQIGSECWRGTVTVNFADVAENVVQDRVDLGGTLTFSGGFLRLTSP